jgi:hypothetical protein
LLHIIPYKHYQNAVEQYFNELKYYIKQKQPMNYDKIKESIEYGIKNIKKEHYENYYKALWACHQRWHREATRLCRYGYFYNAYDKKQLKIKYKNTNRLHKKPKIYKD